MPLLVYFPQKEFSPRFGNGFFTISLVESIVREGEGSCCSSKEVVYYILRVQQGTKEHFIEKRYSDFWSLSSKISVATTALLPPKAFAPFFLPDQVDRQNKLSLYLDSLLKATFNRDTALASHHAYQKHQEAILSWLEMVDQRE